VATRFDFHLKLKNASNAGLQAPIFHLCAVGLLVPPTALTGRQRSVGSFSSIR